jgi:excisionase family DNA binding protein
MPEKEETVGIREASQRMGVTEMTIRRNIESGELPAFKVFGRWKIRVSDINRIMRRSGDQDSRDE